MLGRVLEEGLAPSISEALDQPVGLSLRIMEERAYARAKQYVEDTPIDQLKVDHPMVGTVLDVMEQVSLRRRAERARKLNG